MGRIKRPDLNDLKLIPAIGEEMDELFSWLQKNSLTREGSSYQKGHSNSPPAYGETYDGNSVAIIAAPTQRAKKLTQKEIKTLKDTFKENGSGLSGVEDNFLWQAIKNRNANVRELDFKRLPADAMAFYRPFHYPPFDQWGIYLMIEPLLRYHCNLYSKLTKTNLFSNETLMHLVLFEVFHHEFFHHLTESAATTIEIICAALGDSRPIYLDYKKRQYEELIEYIHHPLEEALANAYAWNSLSFISRVKAGYKTTVVKFYQKAIEKHWTLEPEGYREAEYYIQRDHIPGGAHLLAQLTGESKASDQLPLVKLAQSVMPSGFSAYLQKPDIPTWLVGTPDVMESFYNLVPAPNEAYTQLFWPYDTSSIDQYIQQKKKEDKERLEQLKLARKR